MEDERTTYYARHRERLLANQKVYRRAHRDEVNQYLKNYYMLNKERIAERNKATLLKKNANKPVKVPKPKKVKAPPPEKIEFIPQTYFYSEEPQYSPEQFMLSFD